MECLHRSWLNLLELGTNIQSKQQMEYLHRSWLSLLELGTNIQSK
jgi:hypothetical protein